MGGFGVFGLWVTLALTLVVAIAVALGFLWLSKRTLGENVGPTHNPSLSPFLTVVGLVFGALLGFTVVVAWEQFSSAEANVAHEASTLTTMYRQTVAMPDPQRTQLRQQLRKYAEAVSGPDGLLKKPAVVRATRQEPQSPRCIASSAILPARRVQSMESFSIS